MSTQKASTLAEQRAELRQKISAQRRVIALRIDPPESAAPRAYPRSRTMQFLTQRSGLLLQVAAAVLGRRAIGSITKSLAVAKVLRSFLGPR